jgi:transglutaminase-like putative cysteine protease
MRYIRFSFIVIILLAGITPAGAWQSMGYAVADIPGSLSVNAGAVYRESFQRVTVSGPGAMTIRKRDVITVLRESGIDAATLMVGYNKMVKVSSISGTIYNASGIKVRTIKQDEIDDYSAFDGFSIYSDSRVKRINPKYYNYPFTIEYEYEVSVKTALYLPSFDVFQGYEISVENAGYELIAPADFKIHYLEQNGMEGCTMAKSGKNIIYSWQYGNFPAKTPEPYSPDPFWKYPYVLIAPDMFSIEGYSGRNDSWKSFGSFIASLNSGKQNLPEPAVRAVKELIAGCESREEIIKAVYNYSQKRNRYVSIQIGIGGIEPFDAATVDRFSYGDCKALSNYVMSLLLVAGIEAHYTLVYAGERSRPIVKDFVQDYFNHIILCVPNDGDTIWLECTNPFSPVNYLGSFTDDRHVLLVTDTGGKLTRTPGYTKYENSVTVFSNVHLANSGHATINQNSVHKGTGFGEQMSLRSLDEKDREKVILRSIPLPDISVRSYEFGISPDNPVALNKRLDFEAYNCVTITGDMMMIKQGLVSGSLQVPPSARRRESPVEIRRNFMRTDSTLFHIPAGYQLGSLPADVTFINEMAECSYKYVPGNNQLLVIRQFSMNKGNYPAELYNELREFFEKCAGKDDERLVLKRTDSYH